MYGQRNLCNCESSKDKAQFLNNDEVEPTLESLSEKLTFNIKYVLHPISFKTILRFQQQDKSLIQIAKEKLNALC